MDNYVYCNSSHNNKYYENVDKFSKDHYLNHKTQEELQLDSYKHFINKSKTFSKYTNPPRPHFIETVDIQKPYIKSDGIFERDLKKRIEGPLTLKEKQIFGPLTKDIKYPFKNFNTISLQEERCTWDKNNKCMFPYTKEHLHNPASYGPLENEMKNIYMNNLMNENNKRKSMKNIVQEDMNGLFSF